jgi:hypothetical protein
MADGWEAQLNAHGRNRVVWVGRQIPDQLQKVVQVLGLSITEVRDVKRIDAKAADLFAVFISAVGADAAKAESRLLRLSTMHIPDYGVLLGVASTDPSEAFKLQNTLLHKAQVKIAALGLTSDDFAQALRSHHPGPPASPNLTLPFAGHVQSDYGENHRDDYDSDVILLQRAFNGFKNVTLTPQKGGRSRDCKVWKIEASRETDACEPFVAKAARQEDLQNEFETYRAFVRDFVPFPFRAPILEDRFVKGSTRAVLISAFVGRSQRLDEYLSTASNPELVMVSLFEGALGKWRRGAKGNRGSLGHFYVEQQKAAKESSASDAMAKSLLPDPEGLVPTYENVRNADAAIFNPLKIWSMLDSLPITDYYVCRAHGDLNVRNIFVRWNSMDTVLIDFSHSGINESLARDPAKLETSIGLNVCNKENKQIPESILRKLYQSPLLPPRDFVVLDGRTDAIYQIRRHAGGEGITNQEYEILVICHLLRFACEPVDKSNDNAESQNRRSISYILACNLLKNLKQA